jgi:hypothetical protein
MMPAGDIDITGRDWDGESDRPWVAMLFGVALGRFASRDEAIAAVNARNRINLATVRNVETRDVWRRLKYGRFVQVRDE